MSRSSRSIKLSVALFAASFFSTLGLVLAQQPSYEFPPVNYSKSKPTDPVAELDARLAAGEQTLAYEDSHGYLTGVLDALRIPVSSQSLVFSGTSFQQLIAPWRPRAIYFNDDTYIAWVQGSKVLEVASMDPQLGANFYLLQPGSDSATPLRPADPQLPSMPRHHGADPWRARRHRALRLPWL